MGVQGGEAASVEGVEMDSPGVVTSAPKPQRFGRYILIDRLGKGGMAEVFSAIMPGAEGFRRDVVIKQIRPDQSRARHFIDMFVHEARISALLHHPNIVQVFDFGQVDGCYFLAMELLHGRDLLAIMKALRERRRPFPIPLVAHIAQEVALGLAYAHALCSPDNQPLHILHRDVSPSNIMCLTTGDVKLLDFGIASALGEVDASDGEESTFKGKLSYMAPERMGVRAPPDGERTEVTLDGRIDLFALGIVTWEMLAGRRLFHGKTDAEKLRAILEKPIPLPSTLRPDVPPRLDEIVMRALERDPDRRYRDGRAFADDLEEVAVDAKYQSRMLPALLVDLFGTDASHHIAISNLSADLLFVEPTGSARASQVAQVTDERSLAQTSAPPAPAAAVAIPVGEPAPLDSAPVAEVSPGSSSWLKGTSSTGRRRRLAFALVGGLALMGMGLALAISRPPRSAGGGMAVRAAARPSVKPTVVTTPGPSGVPTLSPPSPSGSRQFVTDTAPALPREVVRTVALPSRPGERAGGAGATARNPAVSRSAKVAPGRVTKGLSIDPFAEAASRRAVKPQ